MLNQFLERLTLCLDEPTFVSMTLSRKRLYDSDLEKIMVKPVMIKSQLVYQFVYRYLTKDVTKNISKELMVSSIEELLEEEMKNANLFTTTGDHVLKQNKKRRWKLFATKPTFTSLPELVHDRKKMYIIEKDRPFLKELGIINSSGNLIKEKGDKFRQIQKFVEIISNLISKEEVENPIRIVDMGSGKAYLTFALYDYLFHTLNRSDTMLGIELRPKLVEHSNHIAENLNFKNIDFQVGGIAETVVTDVDMLIALHACDTATDDAIYKGITNEAKWIICSPCCQHQVRKDMKNDSFLKGLLKYGILMERMAELLTDGIRALILESYGYETKVFEFISNDHTGKNIIIVAEKRDEVDLKRKEEIEDEIDCIKKEMSISKVYLQTLFD